MLKDSLTISKGYHLYEGSPNFLADAGSSIAGPLMARGLITGILLILKPVTDRWTWIGDVLEGSAVLAASFVLFATKEVYLRNVAAGLLGSGGVDAVQKALSFWKTPANQTQGRNALRQAGEQLRLKSAEVADSIYDHLNGAGLLPEDWKGTDGRDRMRWATDNTFVQLRSGR